MAKKSETNEPKSELAEQRAPSPMARLRDVLEKNQHSIAVVAPAHLTPERMAKIAMACASRDAKLLDCDPVSILRCLVTSAELGLEPSGGTRGEAYLVPFHNRQTNRTEAQLIPGYRGLLKLARQTGEVASISCRLVYEGDQFELVHGTEERLVHVPKLDGERGAVRLAYGVAKLKDGSVHVEVMTLRELEAIRSRSKASGFGPWKTDTDEMYRKTVARRLCKWLPLSPDKADALSRAEEIDNQQFRQVVLVPGQGPALEGVAGLRAALPLPEVLDDGGEGAEVEPVDDRAPTMAVDDDGQAVIE